MCFFLKDMQLFEKLNYGNYFSYQGKWSTVSDLHLQLLPQPL